MHRRLQLSGIRQPGEDFRVKLRWRACGNAVKQLGVALGHHHGLPPAVGAAFKVGMAHRLAVVGVGERLGGRCHVVVRAQAPVFDLFRVVQRPSRAFAAVVAHVAGSGHKAVADVLCEARVRDRPGVAARAIELEAARPVFRGTWDPHFELDLRIRRWPGHALNAAEFCVHIDIADFDG